MRNIKFANEREFKATLGEYLLIQKKEAADAINTRVVQILIGSKGYDGAVQLTPKATAARIRSDLGKKYGVAQQVEGKRRTWIQKPVKLIYLKATQLLKKQGIGKGLTPDQWRSAVAIASQKIWDARNRSRAYLAAGWLNCVMELGRVTKTGEMWQNGQTKKLRGVVSRRGHPSTDASGARPATARSLICVAWNAAAGDKGSKTWGICNLALQKAISNQILDMRAYIGDRISKGLRRARRK